MDGVLTTVDMLTVSLTGSKVAHGHMMYPSVQTIAKASVIQCATTPNGGSGTMPGQAMTYGSSSALYANQFTNPGYTFVGWSTNRDGSTVDYEDGEIVYNLTNKDGSTVDLYAVWRSDVTVVYDANGGNLW